MVLPMLGALAAPLISGAMGLAGGIMQNSAASAAADKQMDFQDRANAKQMAFQKESAQHSYQWAMEDMRKAGLNPILAYKQGGAGTLSGSTSSGSSYTPQNVGTAAATAAQAGTSSAVAAQRNEAELLNIAADTKLKASQDVTQQALTTQAMANAGLASANTAVAQEEAYNRVVQGDLLRQAFQIEKPKATIAGLDDVFWNSPAAQPLLVTRRIMESLAPGSTLANSAANIANIGR